MNPSLDKNLLKEFLEEKYSQYATPRFTEDDPIQFLHRFNRKEDIEIVGLLTATISWGNRKMIINSMNGLLQRIGGSPFEFVVNFTKNDSYRFEGFVHRTFNDSDCLDYIKVLKHIYSKGEGLEDLFTKGFQTDGSIKAAIARFRLYFIECNVSPHLLKHVPSVEQGSACKRINMFLRWMIRPSHEGVDFGLWKAIPTSALMMPLDTHSGRVARSLGILNRKQDDWKAVEELTSLLREFDPNDPVKYDYALFGLGVNEKFGV
jgi:uncharacterized protein (TIGR02757 family)